MSCLILWFHVTCNIFLCHLSWVVLLCAVLSCMSCVFSSSLILFYLILVIYMIDCNTTDETLSMINDLYTSESLNLKIAQVLLVLLGLLCVSVCNLVSNNKHIALTSILQLKRQIRGFWCIRIDLRFTLVKCDYIINLNKRQKFNSHKIQEFIIITLNKFMLFWNDTKIAFSLHLSFKYHYII